MNTKTEIVSSDFLAGIVPFVKREKGCEFSRTVEYIVHGFWGCYIQIHQFWSWEMNKWKEPEIRWSSDARDRVQNPNCLKPTMCFALALQDAVEHAAKMTEKAVTE